MPVDLSMHSDSTLKAMYHAYKQGLTAHLGAHRPYWSSKLGIRSGTLTNLESGLAWMATFGNTSLKAGCVELQNATFRAISPFKGGWTVVKWRVGSSAVGHSAVLVHKSGSDPHAGYMFDPWIEQSAIVWTYDEWLRKMMFNSLLGADRPQ